MKSISNLTKKNCPLFEGKKIPTKSGSVLIITPPDNCITKINNKKNFPQICIIKLTLELVFCIFYESSTYSK